RRGGYALPLASVGPDLKGAVGAIAAYRLALKHGLLPEPAAQSGLYLAYKAALEWLRGVAAGTVTPILEDDEGESETPSGPLIASDPDRGWCAVLSVNVRSDLPDVHRLLRKLEPARLAGALKNIGEEGVNLARESFQRSVEPDGETKWKPLSPSTLKSF